MSSHDGPRRDQLEGFGPTRNRKVVAEEITEVFRTQVWPAYIEKGMSPEQLKDLVERLKPLSIAGLATAYEAAITETKRETIERRTR